MLYDYITPEWRRDHAAADIQSALERFRGWRLAFVLADERLLILEAERSD